MIFSKTKQIKNKRFGYDPRYSESEKKEKTLSFREDGIFMSRQDEVAGNIRSLKYSKRAPARSTNKVTKFMLILALMGTIYVVYSSSFELSDAWGGELTKVMVGFFVMFIFLFLFIKKSNSSI